MADLRYFVVTLSKPDTEVCPGRSVTEYYTSQPEGEPNPKGSVLELTKTVYKSRGAVEAVAEVKAEDTDAIR